MTHTQITPIQAPAAKGRSARIVAEQAFQTAPPSSEAALATGGLAVASAIDIRQYAYVENALDAALLILESGGSTAMADRAFRKVLKGLHLKDVSAIWRLDCVLVAIGEQGRATTLSRPIGTIGVNLARASEAAHLAEQITKGEIAMVDFPDEIRRIRQLPTIHNRWTMTAAAACAGALFSQTIAADHGAFLVCVVAAGIGQLARSQLQSWDFSRASITFLCALLSGLIATAGLRLEITQSAAAALIGSIIYTVPGLLLINGFLDLTSERLLIVGAQRLLHATFLFLILTIAMAIVDTIA